MFYRRGRRCRGQDGSSERKGCGTPWVGYLTGTHRHHHHYHHHHCPVVGEENKRKKKYTSSPSTSSTCLGRTNSHATYCKNRPEGVKRMLVVRRPYFSTVARDTRSPLRLRCRRVNSLCLVNERDRAPPVMVQHCSPRMELELRSRQLMATCSLSTSTPSPRLEGGESSRFPKLGPPPWNWDFFGIYRTDGGGRDWQLKRVAKSRHNRRVQHNKPSLNDPRTCALLDQNARVPVSSVPVCLQSGDRPSGPTSTETQKKQPRQASQSRQIVHRNPTYH